MSTTERPRILIVGGGYVGLYAARRILKKMRDGEATVTVVDPRAYMTYQPFLPETAAGSISPRNVVVPMRRAVPGAETIGEVEDLARDAAKFYKNVKREDMRFVLVDAADKVLPEVGPELGVYGRKHLESRGIVVYLSTTMPSCVDGLVVLSNGLEVDSNTIVWTAGVKPNPALSRFGLPLGPRGHVDTQATLQVAGSDYIWAAGDNAQVPDLVGRANGNPNAWCPPNAQHAMRQAKVLGDNVVSGMRGFPQGEYKHANKGAVAGLGLHKGVAMIVMGKMKIKLKGRLAWYMHRGYHGLAMPTYNRKIRVIAEWTINMFQKRDITALGALETPREEFYEAAKPAPKPAAEAPKAEEKKDDKVEEKAKAS